MAKKKTQLVDGLGPKNIAQIRTALRQVWSWSYARRLCVKRCLVEGGFSRCEQCKQIVPKIYPDHVIPCGDVDEGYIARMFVPSRFLQGLCNKCHNAKTNDERWTVKDFK